MIGKHPRFVRTGICAVLSIAPFSLVAQTVDTLDPALKARVDRIATEVLEQTGVPSASVAVVDHGKLAVLDTPTRLKDSVPGNDRVEAEFEGAPADWDAQLKAMPQVAAVNESGGVTHIATNDGPATVAAAGSWNCVKPMLGAAHQVQNHSACQPCGKAT